MFTFLIIQQILLQDMNSFCLNYENATKFCSLKKHPVNCCTCIMDKLSKLYILYPFLPSEQKRSKSGIFGYDECSWLSKRGTTTAIVIFFDPRGRPWSRPLVITIFTPVVRLYVRTHFSKSTQTKQIFAAGRYVGWPSGSLMTPVLSPLHLISRKWFSLL